jgi:DNA-directed RNA polymerase specialized sigma24 family protein
LTTQESFDALLTWLDPDDRDAAGRAYESIRVGLINILISKGFSNAEDLADDTIERVTSRVLDIRDTYAGPRVKYFFGVLRNVLKEQRFVKEVATDEFPVHLVEPAKTNKAYDCLIECLKSLPHKQCDLILDYYSYEGRNKVESHNKMANDLGISENALRMRTFYIRTKLEKCVKECVSRTQIKAVKKTIGNRIGH